MLLLLLFRDCLTNGARFLEESQLIDERIEYLLFMMETHDTMKKDEVN